MRSVFPALAALLATVASAQQPAPPAKRPLTFADAIAVRIVSDPQISPDGSQVVYAVTRADLAANTRVTMTYVSSVAGGAPRAFPDDTTRAHDARWSPDGKRLAYVAGGQLWVADASGANRAMLTHLSGGANGPVWAPTGDRLAFTSAVYPSCDDDACDAARAKAHADDPVKAHIADSLMYRHWDAWDDATRQHLFVALLDGSAPRDLTPHAPYDVPPGPFGSSDGYAFSPDGKEVAYTAKDAGREDAWSTDANVYLVPVSGGSPAPFTTANTGADADPVFSPEGRYIVYRSQARANFESDRWRIMVFDRRARTSRELAPAWDRSAERCVFAPDGKSLLIEAIDAARTRLYRLTLAESESGVTAEGVPQAIVSERNNAEVTIDRMGHALAWLRDATDRPPEVLTAALSAGGISSVRTVTHVNDSLLASVRLNAVEDFWFKSVRGDSVQGMLVRPPQWAPGGSYPVVLLIHGGPQVPWLDAWSTRWNAQLFAAPGYAVVLINPRGSPGYGQRFTDAVSQDWGGAAYLDLMNGLDAALAAYPWLDGTRTAAAGGSYGGYMVDWIAGHTDRFKALISHAGVYDLESFAGATDEHWFPDWEFGGPYWDPLAMASQYRMWSPHLSAKRFRTPTLVIAGERDYRVPYTQSLAFFDALQEQGVPSRLIVYPDEGHWVLKPQNQRLWWEQVHAWLARWLAGAATP